MNYYSVIGIIKIVILGAVVGAVMLALLTLIIPIVFSIPVILTMWIAGIVDVLLAMIII